MISVAEALSHLLDLAAPLTSEDVPLVEAAGRVLARDAVARRDQPPFAASAMDGYAVRGADAVSGARLVVVGEAAAGHAHDGSLLPGQAVRIFTGAPVPPGADRVVLQENVTRAGDTVILGESLDRGPHIRPQAADFADGSTLAAPRVLRAPDIALLAAMNVARVPVTRRPEVAIIATGDELVMPGETPSPQQIIASNSFGLKAMLEGAGARARLLPIARDTIASLEIAFGLAEGADLVVTIGVASVGDHDLVARVDEGLGMERAFYKVAIRPGKPLMAGRMGQMAMVGLPGNPVSAMVCGYVFVLPLVRAMLGLGKGPAPRLRASLATDLPQNGPREDYMRAHLDEQGGIAPFEKQDSSLLSVLSCADALLVRPPHYQARKAGEVVEYLPL